MSIFPRRWEPVTLFDVVAWLVLAFILTALLLFALLTFSGCAAASPKRAKLVPLPIPSRCLIVDNFSGVCKPARGGGWTCEKVHLAVRNTPECQVLRDTVVVDKGAEK